MAFHYQYRNQLVDAMNVLRIQNQLCDITIIVGGRSFQAHKTVLAASSPYFLKMFTSGFKESTETEICVDGDPGIFAILLNYAYTGSLQVTSQTAYDVLDLACYMGFIGAVDCFNEYIKSKCKLSKKSKSSKKTKSTTSWKVTDADVISAEDVFKISHLARLASTGDDYLEEVVEHTEKYLCQHVGELKNAGAFLQTADEDFVKSFLKRPTLPTEEDSELQILELVVNWLKHDLKKRSIHAVNLLQMVCLGLVPKQNINKLVGPDILAMPECEVLFQEHLKEAKEQPSSDTVVDLAQKSQCGASRSIITAPVVFFSGNSDDDHEESQNKYPRNKYRDSSESETEDEDRYYFGNDDSEWWNMHYYDIEANKWKQLSKFNTLLDSTSLIVVEGKLYSAGGYKFATIDDENDYEEGSDLSDYEDVKHYRNRGSYRSSRRNFEEEYFDYYIDDGSESDDDYIYNDLHVSRKKFLFYSAESNKWKPLESMKKARRDFPMVFLDGYIYAIGGYDVHKKLLIGDVERFNLEKNKWENLACLPEGYHWASAVTDGKKIFAYGMLGLDVALTSKDHKGKVIYGRVRKHVFQVYDPSTNTWQCKYEKGHETHVPYADKNSLKLVASEALLFLYKDHCYRVLYRWHKSSKAKEGKESEKEADHLWPFTALQPYSVAMLELTGDEGDIQFSVGESFSQDLMPHSRLGPFCIKDEVFVSVKGSVYKTDVKIVADQTTKVDLKSWRGLKIAKAHSNVVHLTIDQQRLGYYKR